MRGPAGGDAITHMIYQGSPMSAEALGKMWAALPDSFTVGNLRKLAIACGLPDDPGFVKSYMVRLQNTVLVEKLPGGGWCLAK